MDDRTKGFVIRAVTVTACIALAFGVFVYINALWIGRTVFPEQLANAITFLLVAAVSSASVWLHSRNSARTRQTVRDAETSIKRTMVDGGGEIIAEKVAEKVKAQVEPMIRDPERRHPAIPNDTGSRRRDSDPHADIDDTERWR